MRSERREGETPGASEANRRTASHLPVEETIRLDLNVHHVPLSPRAHVLHMLKLHWCLGARRVTGCFRLAGTGAQLPQVAMPLHTGKRAEVPGPLAAQRLQRAVHGRCVQCVAREVPAHRREKRIRLLCVVDGVAAYAHQPYTSA